MTKKELIGFIMYLRTHPGDAQLLREALFGESECKQTSSNPRWMSAAEVGEQIGQSSRWVRERVHLLPPEAAQQRGNRKTWYINFTENISEQLQQLRQ